jgi:hypothetical protein
MISQRVFPNCPVYRKMRPPTAVVEVDLSDRVWPHTKQDEKVDLKYYAMLSMARSWTGFHIGLYISSSLSSL